MSRSQPPYLPTHVQGVRAGGFDTGLDPVSARNRTLRTLESDSNGQVWIQVSTPMDLEDVKATTIDVLQQIQGKLSECRLTKAEQGVKKRIFTDLDKVADVLFMVLRAHRDAASGIKHIVRFSPQGNVVQVVEGHLTSAWSSIHRAREEFFVVKNTILKQSNSLKEGVDTPPGFVIRQSHKAVNNDLPGKSSFPSLVIGLATLVVNSAAASDIAKRLPGAVVGTNILGVLTLAFGGAMQVAKYLGTDAAIYESGARDTTEKALECIHGHLFQFCKALSSLQAYWQEIHSARLNDGQVNADPLQLLSIVTILEKHVDDCLVVITAIRKLSVPMTVTPTRLDVYDERNGITHGMFGLPSSLQ